MAVEQVQEQPKRTASQRIDDLERGIVALYQTAENIARDMMVARDAIKLLGNKLDSVVKLLNRELSEKVNDDAIAQQMVSNNIEELKERVTKLVTDGTLVASEEITDRSFIVGQEIDDKGAVVNPRLQFALGALNEELKTKLKAAKLGETVVLQEGKLQFKVTESYTIQQPTQQQAAPAPVTETPADTETQSSKDEASAPAEQSSVSQ